MLPRGSTTLKRAAASARRGEGVRKEFGGACTGNNGIRSHSPISNRSAISWIQRERLISTRSCSSGETNFASRSRLPVINTGSAIWVGSRVTQQSKHQHCSCALGVKSVLHVLFSSDTCRLRSTMCSMSAFNAVSWRFYGYLVLRLVAAKWLACGAANHQWPTFFSVVVAVMFRQRLYCIIRLLLLTFDDMKRKAR